MSTKFYVIAVWTLLSFVVKVNAQDKVECWDQFELSFKQVILLIYVFPLLSFVERKRKRWKDFMMVRILIGYGLCLLSPGNGGMLHLPV